MPDWRHLCCLLLVYKSEKSTQQMSPCSQPLTEQFPALSEFRRVCILANALSQHLCFAYPKLWLFLLIHPQGVYVEKEHAVSSAHTAEGA